MIPDWEGVVRRLVVVCQVVWWTGLERAVQALTRMESLAAQKMAVMLERVAPQVDSSEAQNHHAAAARSAKLKGSNP